MSTGGEGVSELIYSLLRLSFSAVPVILVVMAGRLILSFAPKKYSYALWSVVAFRLCVPFSFKSHFSFRVLGQSIVALFEKGSEVQNITPSLPPLTESVTELVPPAPAVTAPAVDSMGIAETLPVIENTSRTVSFSDILPTLLAALWIVGIAVFLILGVVSYVKLKRSVADATRTEGRIYVHRDVTSPFVIGILKPRILLPEGLDEATAEAVLAHENCHIRRGDHIIKTAAFLILAVHWFNPFCYLAFFLMSRDMEMSCDEKVLASMDHPDKRKEYSMAILKTATNNSSIRSTVSFGGVGVKKRIRYVLDYKKPSALISVFALAICAMMLFACAANAPEDNVYGNYEPKYEELTPSVFEINELDDAVTRALLEFQNKGSIGGGITSCESHAIVKTLENKDENTISVIVLRENHIGFDPITGYKTTAEGMADLHIIKFEITENGYERRNFMSDPKKSISSIEYIFGDFFPGEGEEALAEFIDSFGGDLYTGSYEMTPFRYEKDGELYEVDDKKSLRYFESLIGAVLDSEENYDDPEGYITENAEAFEKLYTEIGIDDFLIHEFSSGGNDDLRGYVMYRALEEYLKYENEMVRAYAEPFEYDPTDENGKKNGQKYFDAFVQAAVDMFSEKGYLTAYSMHYRTWRKVFELHVSDMTPEEYANLDHVYPLPDKIAVHGEKEYVFSKGDEKYYELYKCASGFFFKPEDADTVSEYIGEVSGAEDSKVQDVLKQSLYRPSVEFIYDDGVSGYIIVGGGAVVLIEKESGTYDAYRIMSVGGGLGYYLRVNFMDE